MKTAEPHAIQTRAIVAGLIAQAEQFEAAAAADIPDSAEGARLRGRAQLFRRAAGLLRKSLRL